MNCPRCKCEIPNDAEVCEVCGKKLRKKKLFSSFKEKKKEKKVKNSADAAIKKDTKLKIILAAVVTALIIGIIVFIVSVVDDNTGVNLVDDIKDYLNSPVKTAINETDVYFADESAYEITNFITDFDYIIEDDDSVEIDGVEYPEWAIFINADDKDEIRSIKYVYFGALEKNPKGSKTDKEISIDKFTTGDKYRKVDKEIDAEVFSITYEGGSITYDYRYYFKNEFKDEQAMSLSVVCDWENEYIYSTAKREIPDYVS